MCNLNVLNNHFHSKQTSRFHGKNVDNQSVFNVIMIVLCLILISISRIEINWVGVN